MKIKVNVFPNLEDEEPGVVAFWVIFSHHEENEPLLNEFSAKIEGYIPAADSVAELKKAALEKAKTILARFCQEN